MNATSFQSRLQKGNRLRIAVYMIEVSDIASIVKPYDDRIIQ